MAADYQFSAPPTPLIPQSCELPPFPVRYLPPVLRDYVWAVSEHAQTDPAMAATFGLGVLSVCLQAKLQVESVPGYCEPVNLYTMVVAPPGERKSSVLKAMTGALSDYECAHNKAHAAEIKEYQRKRQMLDRRICAIDRKLSQCIDLNEELEAQLREAQDQLEALPKCVPLRLWADDSTGEALVDLLAEAGGTFAVVSSEGGIFDNVRGKYSGVVNIDALLKSHCGDAIAVDRIGRKGAHIERPSLTTILAIQPQVLDELMGNAVMRGRGLMARLLYAFPPSLVGERCFTTQAVDPRLHEDYRALVFRLLAIPTPEEPKTLRLSADAQELMAYYFGEHERYLAGEGKAIADWSSKYIGCVLTRIAGLLHGAEAGVDEDEISAETLCKASDIGKYYLAQAEYAYCRTGMDTSVQKAQTVLAKIRKIGALTLKRAELHQQCRGNMFPKAKDLTPTLELLAAHNYLRIEYPPERKSAGRPADVMLIINPLTLDEHQRPEPSFAPKKEVDELLR